MKKRILSYVIAVVMILGTMSFTVFAEEATYVAKVGGVECADASAMISALNNASGGVTVGIYGKVKTSGFGINNSKITKLSFVAESDDAEICVDGVSYIDVRYTNYPIEYTGLTLSHINAGQNIDGFLPQYFSTYNGGNVTYRNCTFPNGVTACGSVADTTYKFTDCTFNNTTSGLYSLWIYGNSTNVVVDGGTFSGVRGIKLYSEGSNDFSSLSVNGATFSDTITEKHAVVLTKGECVTLTNNTFNNAKGTVEVDNDYASSIDGKTVTIDGTEYIVDSNNLTLEEVTPIAPAKLPAAKLEKLAPMVLTETDDYKVYDGSLRDGVGDRTLNVVVKFSAIDTEETVLESPYKGWYTDFYITFDGLKNGSFVADGCYLAGIYDPFPWIVIPVDGLEIEEGEVYPVVSVFDPQLTYEEICTGVKEMICAIYIKPEIIDANPDMTVTLNLGIKNGDDGEVVYVNSSVYDAVELAGYVAKVGDKKYTSLADALNAAVTAGEDVTVEILSDIDLEGVNWIPVSVNGAVKPAAHLVTINGNNHKITHLNNMLFSGTWAGKSGLIINDLTIADSNIVNDKDDTAGTVGVGAFIGYPQASETITLNNCHLINSTVEGGHWTGGLIGMAGGYNGNDGPVFMNLTITGCSVKDSVIKGKGSAGGLMGHASCAAWTKVVVEDTVVSGNTVTSTGSSNEKAGAVFGTVGAAGTEATADGETKTGGQFVAATVKNNTVTSNGTTITTIYGRQGTNTGKLQLTGGSYDHKPISGEESWAGIKVGFALEENADGTYSVEREYTITLSADGGKYADGTSAVAFNASYEQWNDTEVSSFGMYIFKKSDKMGTKITVDTGDGKDLKAANGLFNVVVTEIPESEATTEIICLPYVIINNEVIPGSYMAVSASQFLKNLID